MNSSKQRDVVLPYSGQKTLYDTGDRGVYFSKTSVPNYQTRQCHSLVDNTSLKSLDLNKNEAFHSFPYSLNKKINLIFMPY
jgi:hypothetical protein